MSRNAETGGIWFERNDGRGMRFPMRGRYNDQVFERARDLFIQEMGLPDRVLMPADLFNARERHHEKASAPQARTADGRPAVMPWLDSGSVHDVWAAATDDFEERVSLLHPENGPGDIT